MKQRKNNSGLRPTPGTSTGGYAQRRKVKAPVAAVQVNAEPKVKLRPMPPGVGIALRTMASLARDLRGQLGSKALFNTSIEPLYDAEEGQPTWELIVHGVNPGLAYYAGYPVRYAPGSLIRNPACK